MQEAEKAKSSLDLVLSKSTSANLFGQHPPFQMDANFGTTAGIAEMLLQSHNGRIIVLPALPDSWPDGSVSGLKARGNYTVAMTWQTGKLKKLTVTAHHDQICRVQYKSKQVEFPVQQGKSYDFGPDLESI